MVKTNRGGRDENGGRSDVRDEQINDRQDKDEQVNNRPDTRPKQLVLSDVSANSVTRGRAGQCHDSAQVWVRGEGEGMESRWRVVRVEGVLSSWTSE